MTAGFGDVFFVVVHFALLSAIVDGSVITRTPLQPPQGMTCLDECQILDNGTIVIINGTYPKQAVAGAAYSKLPVRMKDPATRTAASFNTSFSFREHPMRYNVSDPRNWMRGDGFVFAIVNSSTWVGAPAGRLGMFKDAGQPKVVAVEFDNWKNNDTDSELQEHVGVDIASAVSVTNCVAAVSPLGISLWKGEELRSWIEYDAISKLIQVRVANSSSRPLKPLVNCTIDLYDSLDEKMWIGFSGAHGDAWSVYNIYDWRFTSFGIPGDFSSPSSKLRLIVGICGGISMAFLVFALGVGFYLRKQRGNGAWSNEGLLEMANMPEYISYKHLSAATKQFSDESKLGAGGFGSVYRGVLPKSGAKVAVKKVGNDSKQGEKEFLAEVQIISQLRHRNIVELLGFCRDRGKFLLVYELLPRGSLDKALFKPHSPRAVLSWGQRWKIVSGTASALHYLHEGWKQQVIHRDVKSSNIMLDDDYNAKLGDFGLARLVDHEKKAATTMVGGTYGYMAPEATGGKFTDKTDVFAFGAVALEICCGRKAFASSAGDDDMLLVDMVWRHLTDGDLLGVVDPRLGGDYDEKQVEELLLLGLLCSHPSPAARLCMRQVVHVLAGEAPLPPVPASKPEPVFSGNLVSMYKVKLSSSRLRTKSGRLQSESSEFSRSAPFDSEHATAVDTGTTSDPSLSSESCINPKLFLFDLSKSN